jgi:hypothetical protein
LEYYTIGVESKGGGWGAPSKDAKMMERAEGKKTIC